MDSDRHTLNLDHIAITVQDMERAVKFYRDILGFEVLGQLLLRDNTFKIVYLKAGDARIELFAFTEEGARLPSDMRDPDLGFKHIGFEVDDVDVIALRLKDHGVHFTVEPKDASAGGVRLAFFHDPDGNLLEIVAGTLNLKPYQPGWDPTST